MGSWQYDDSDIERLSTIMTLHDIGFTKAEVERYMKLLLQGASGEESGLKCWKRKKETERSMKFILRNGNWTGWIICGLK